MENMWEWLQSINWATRHKRLIQHCLQAMQQEESLQYFFRLGYQGKSTQIKFKRNCRMRDCHRFIRRKEML